MIYCWCLADGFEGMLRKVERVNTSRHLESINVSLPPFAQLLPQLQLVALARLLVVGTSQFPTVLRERARSDQGAHHSHIETLSLLGLHPPHHVSGVFTVDTCHRRNLYRGAGGRLCSPFRIRTEQRTGVLHCSPT